MRIQLVRSDRFICVLKMREKWAHASSSDFALWSAGWNRRAHDMGVDARLVGDEPVSGSVGGKLNAIQLMANVRSMIDRESERFMNV